jgi:hypothetical protein
MSDKIIQVSGFGVNNTKDTQCDYMLVAVTESGEVLISQGDSIWTKIGPRPVVMSEAQAMSKVPLSQRVRPNSEAAPWVIEEIKEYERRIAELETASSISKDSIGYIKMQQANKDLKKRIKELEVFKKDVNRISKHSTFSWQERHIAIAILLKEDKQ